MNDLEDVVEEADALAELARPRRSAQSRIVVVDPDIVLDNVWPYSLSSPERLLFDANRAPRSYLLSLVPPYAGLAAARLASAKKGAENLNHRVVKGLWKKLELMPLVEPGCKRESTHLMARAFSESVTATTHCGRQVTREFMRWMAGGPPPSLELFNCMAMFVDMGYVGDASARDRFPWETTSLKISPAWACVMDMNHAYGTPEVHNRVDWSKTATPGCVYGDEIAGAFLSGLASFDSNTGELTDPDSLTYSDRFLTMSTFCFVRGARDCISLAQDTDGYRLGLQFMGMPGGSGGPLDREVSQIFLLTPSERWMKGGDLASSSLGVDGFIRARETAEYWLGVAALGFYLNYGTPCEIVEGSLVEVPRHVRCMTKRLAEMFDRTRAFAARAARGDDSGVRVWDRKVSQGVRDALVAWGSVSADISDDDLATFVAALPNVHIDCLSLKDGQFYRILVFDEAGNLVRCVQPNPLPNLLTWPPAPSRVDDATFIDLDDPKYRGPVLEDASLREALGKQECTRTIRANAIDGVCCNQLNKGINCYDGGKCGYKYHFGGLFSSNERRLTRDGAHDLCAVCSWPFVLLTSGGSARCQNAYCQRDYYLDVVRNAEETGGELPTHWITRDNERPLARRIADAKAARIGTPAANPPPQELLERLNERGSIIKELKELGCEFDEEGLQTHHLKNMLDRKKANVGGTKKGDHVVVLENNGRSTKAYARRTGVVKKVKSSGGWRDVLFDGAQSVTGIPDKFLRKITVAAPAPAPASADMEL